MDDSQPYIKIPRSKSRPVRIDVLLAKRMREFLLSRRRGLRRQRGR